jgi:hypothetical protein
MWVLSNQRLGPAAELVVSPDIARVVLSEIADAARPRARARWEHELVRWLDAQAARIASISPCPTVIDVGEIAFTPQHFDHQRSFLLEAIALARVTSVHAITLGRWAELIHAHSREFVQFGRRWKWSVSN